MMDVKKEGGITLSRSQKKRLARNKKKSIQNSQSGNSDRVETQGSNVGTQTQCPEKKPELFTTVRKPKKRKRKTEPDTPPRSDVTSSVKSSAKKIRRGNGGDGCNTHNSLLETVDVAIDIAPSLNPPKRKCGAPLDDYPFETEYGDHFETSPDAYRHIE